MYDVNKEYNKEYYGKRMDFKKIIYPRIAKVIQRNLLPENVVDVGCGNGALMSGLNCPVIGIEASESGIKIATEQGFNVIEHDLRLRLKTDFSFDLAVSIEVAEHLEEEYAEIFVDNLIKLSDKVLVTASSAKSKYHYNPQEKEYWIKLFKSKGYLLSEKTNVLVNELKKHIPKKRDYLYKNLMYFEKDNNQNSSDLKICFITSLFGNRRRDDPAVKIPKVPGCDYFLVTDRKIKTRWEIIDNKFHEIELLKDNVRKSRYAKFMGWHLLEQFNKNYDFVFYCDSYLYPKKEIDWEKIALETMSKDFPFIQSKHNNRRVRKGGINSEMDLIVKINKDSKENIEKTKCFFKNYNSSVSLNYPNYYMNTFFGYDPNNIDVRKFTFNFWRIYTTEDITYRDQPLWNFLLRQEDVRPFDQYNLLNYFDRGH